MGSHLLVARGFSSQRQYGGQSNDIQWCDTGCRAVAAPAFAIRLDRLGLVERIKRNQEIIGIRKTVAASSVRQFSNRYGKLSMSRLLIARWHRI